MWFRYSFSGYRPIFYFQSWHAGEFQGVGRDQHCAAPARLSCDQHVMGADRRAEAFELGADFTGLLGILRLEEPRGPCCRVQSFVSGERVEVTSGGSRNSQPLKSASLAAENSDDEFPLVLPLVLK
jgi:hypothetical protein